MRIVISAKDSDNKKVYEDVKEYYHDYGAFHIVFEDGAIRIYPDRHIWYIEQAAEQHSKSKR